MIDKQALTNYLICLRTFTRNIQTPHATGALMVIQGVQSLVDAGAFDAEPDLVAYTEEDLDTEDMTDEDEEEESATFGVFCVWPGAGPEQRSHDIPQAFSTRSEAWSAVIRNVVRTKGELDSQDYEVRPL